MTTVAQALAKAQALGLDRLDAQRLLGHVLMQSRTWLLAHDDAPLATEHALAFDRFCSQRADDVPMGQLLGEQEFCGLNLVVTRDVLVPRPDTETLVDWALDLLPAGAEASPNLLDMGTGSGAIALAVKYQRPTAQVMATDLSQAALDVARANAQRLKLDVSFRQGGWWQAVPEGMAFDVVLSNPPYIAGDDPHLPALRHEPALALTPGGDGLDSIRTIIAGALAHLKPDGWLLLEHGWDQAQAVTTLLREAQFTQVQSRRDLAGHTRCTGGQRKPMGC
jgi:release factor glutamine methyltransferase